VASSSFPFHLRPLSNNPKRRVLVTGASGLIGRHLCSQLADQGHHVAAISRRRASSSHIAEQFEAEHIAEEFEADVLDTAALRSVVELAAPDLVVHLAWNGEDRVVSPLNIDHLRASSALLDACSAAGVDRVITAGTSIEYTKVDSPRDERTTPCVPQTPYGAAKHALGATLGAHLAAGSLRGAHARIFYTFGPGEMPPRLIAHVMTELLAGRRPTVSAGTQLCDYLVVDDVAAALCQVAMSEVDGPVNIASGTAVTVRSLILQAAAAVGSSEDDIDFCPPGEMGADHSTTCANITRLRDEVGFTPSFTMSEAMAHTADYYSARQQRG
jgi:nucleoside-diphosphate-sugar epimerase